MLAHRTRRMCGRLAIAATLCLIAAASVFAQTTSATVSGSVKDALGGVLPGASVTLVSGTQGTAQTAATDPLGTFLFPYVRPDT